MRTWKLRCCLAVLLIPLALLPLSALTPAAQAQNAAPSVVKPAKPKRVRSAVKSANMKTGEIAAIDTTAQTLTLKERTGKTVTYALTDRTHILKNKRPVELSDFKVGDVVALRVRKARGDEPPKVGEMADPETAQWLKGLRTKTQAVAVKEISEDRLVASLGGDEVSYVISDKTRWSKGGKEAAPEDFKAGETVYIVPRGLPNGAIMARAVADSEQAAARLKERLARSLHGTLQGLDTTQHQITLLTAAGETRILPYTEETEVRQGGKTLPLAALKPGQRVSVSIRRNEAD